MNGRVYNMIMFEPRTLIQKKMYTLIIRLLYLPTENAFMIYTNKRFCYIITYLFF